MSLVLSDDNMSVYVSLYALPNSLMFPLCTGVPSITIRGSLPALMLLIPRMRMLLTPPGPLDEELMFTPATPPASLSAIEMTGTSSSPSVSRVCADPVKDAFLKLP